MDKASWNDCRKGAAGMNQRQMNFIAFFCSWIYLFVLGLWKKAIIVLLLGILSLFVGALIGVNILGIAVAAYVAVNTNKWFYEKEVKGLNTWSL